MRLRSSSSFYVSPSGVLACCPLRGPRSPARALRASPAALAGVVCLSATFWHCGGLSNVLRRFLICLAAAAGEPSPKFPPRPLLGLLSLCVLRLLVIASPLAHRPPSWRLCCMAAAFTCGLSPPPCALRAPLRGCGGFRLRSLILCFSSYPALSGRLCTVLCCAAGLAIRRFHCLVGMSSFFGCALLFSRTHA